MGLIIAAGNTKPAFPYDYYYGVKININVADTALERVGRSELHVSLPVQSLMRRCCLTMPGRLLPTFIKPTVRRRTPGQRQTLPELPAW